MFWFIHCGSVSPDKIWHVLENDIYWYVSWLISRYLCMHWQLVFVMNSYLYHWDSTTCRYISSFPCRKENNDKSTLDGWKTIWINNFKRVVIDTVYDEDVNFSRVWILMAYTQYCGRRKIPNIIINIVSTGNSDVSFDFDSWQRTTSKKMNRL